MIKIVIALFIALLIAAFGLVIVRNTGGQVIAVVGVLAVSAAFIKAM